MVFLTDGCEQCPEIIFSRVPELKKRILKEPVKLENDDKGLDRFSQARRLDHGPSPVAEYTVVMSKCA